MKLKIGILIFTGVICIVGLYLHINSEKYKFYKDVEDENFEIKYIYEPSMEDYYKIEITIFPNGEFISNKYMTYDEIETFKGYYIKEDLIRFVKYAIRNDINKMTNDMNEINIYDGHNIFYEFKFDDEYLLVGGYMPEYINNDFKKINNRFKELDYEIISE